MEEGRIPETVLSGKFHNKRSVRKQRTRGKDVVQRDALQIPGIREWKKQAGDIEIWGRLLRETRTQSGL
jgi:hypothetical protein